MTRPLWRCPACGRPFANRDQPHACGKLRSVEDHLARADPEVREAYRRLEDAVRGNGPFLVNAQKTRIAFQVRMHFAGCRVARRWIDVGFVLPRRAKSPRFSKVESFSPQDHAHHVRIRTPDEVDDELRGWLAEAYRVGAQEHLGTRAPRRPLDAPKAARSAGRMVVLERTFDAPAGVVEAAWTDARARARWISDPVLRRAAVAAARAAPRRTELGRLWRADAEGARLEVAVAAKGRGRSVLRVWVKGLPDVATRDDLKRRWTAAVEALRARLT